MESEIVIDRFDMGVNWFKYALTHKIQSDYKKPDCRKDEGCIHELALNTYICVSCAKWIAAQEILSIIDKIK